jgi:hypothetical protein
MLIGSRPYSDVVMGRRGTSSGGPALIGGSALAEAGHGLDLSVGTLSHLIFASDAGLDCVSAVTVAVVAKYTVANQWGSMLVRSNTGTHTNPWYDYALSQAGTGSGRMAMRVETANTESTAPTITTGVVHHLLGRWDKTRNSGNPQLFINGSEATGYTNTTAKTSDITPGTQPLTIGMAADGTSDDWAGVFYGGWVYRRWLSDAEVRWHATDPWAMFWEPRMLVSTPVGETIQGLAGFTAGSGWVGRRYR